MGADSNAMQTSVDDGFDQSGNLQCLHESSAQQAHHVYPMHDPQNLSSVQETQARTTQVLSRPHSVQAIPRYIGTSVRIRRPSQCVVSELADAEGCLTHVRSMAQK